MLSRTVRRVMALYVGLAAGVFGFPVGVALTGSWSISAVLSALLAALVSLVFHRRSVAALDGSSSSRGLLILSALTASLALVQLARLSVFMIDPSLVGYSTVPSSEWEVHHSCLSAYYVAADVADANPNVYDDSLFTAPDDDPNTIRKPLWLGPFKIDVFEYPPAFLLLPRALRWITPDFPRLRMLWFGLNGAVLLLGIVLVSSFIGPAAGTRALLLSPLIWLAVSTVGTLQKGNIQATVIAVSLLAMLLFERRRWASGGVLLGFATVSKIYPGMLVLYLLARRNWNAVVWTAVMAVAFVAVSVLDTGWEPYSAFLDRLPGILGGEAFPAFRNPRAMAGNYSIPGLIFKLKLFGVPGMSFGASKILGWIYTLVIVAVTLSVARRNPRDDEKPMVWLSILVLATMRSPFLPMAYAPIPPLWLLTILAATSAPTAKTIALTIAGWAAFNIYWPNDWPVDPRLFAILNGVSQILTMVVVALALRRLSQPGVLTENLESPARAVE